MVGEIRDLETAKIALEAALTGHMKCTPPCTRMPSAVCLTRLRELGVEPSITASAPMSLCSRSAWCGVSGRSAASRTSRAVLTRVPGASCAAAIDSGVTLYRRRGCTRCSKGYRGRTGVHQLMVMDEQISALLIAGAGHQELAAAATVGGMTTLWKDGLGEGGSRRDDGRTDQPRRPLILTRAYRSASRPGSEAPVG